MTGNFWTGGHSAYLDGDAATLYFGADNDVGIYFDGIDLNIYSMNITANDRLLFSDFDLYYFDGPLEAESFDGDLDASDLVGGSAPLAAITNALASVTTDLMPSVAWGDLAGSSVFYRWDYIYPTGIGLCVGPTQPSTFTTNIVYSSGVTQEVSFLAFDDTTPVYTGEQTWLTMPTWTSNIMIRGTSWYTHATPTNGWTLHYCGDGITVKTIPVAYTAVAATHTNLDAWAISTNLVGITAGYPVRYWLSRDVTTGGDGDNYLGPTVIRWEQE